ncbi:MAG TPA: tetratricopeptide repeat protein [Candidatus Saccharimonadales bacterium]|nr:tetratricopeptide repeat protein [Candidatus Saccharimonadales bacterium]
MITFHRPFLAACLLVLVLAGAGCTKQAKAKRFLAKADRDFAAQKYDAAELEYRSVLQLSRLNPAAIRGLGLIYFEDGRSPQAYAYLSEAHKLLPQDLEVEGDLATTYLVFHKPHEAQQLAQQVLAKDPANKRALTTLVDSPRTLAEVAEIRGLVERLRSSNKDASSYHLALGSLALREQKLPDAESELREAIAQDPKSSEGYFLLGAVYLIRKDVKQAGQNFQTAVQLAPLRSNLRLKYADFQIENRELEAAKKGVEEITSQAPDYIPAWIYLMKLLFAERKYDECANVVHTILARDPSNFEGMIEDGNLSLAKGDAAKATAQFQRMETIDKNNPEVKHQLALAYLMSGSRAKAMASLEQAVSISPSYAAAVTLLAELNIRSGNSAAALTRLKVLIKAHPENLQARFLLATAYLAQQRPEDALIVYHDMMGSFPKNPQIPLLMGIVYTQQKQPAPARKSFEKAIELAPDYLPAVERLVGLDLAEKRYAPAMELAKHQIELMPKAAEPLLLQAEVYLRQGQTNQCETVLLKAISLNPALPGPYLSLAQLYVASNKSQEALDRLTTLVSKTNDVSGWMEIGLIHDQLKQYDQAAAAYEKLLEISPQFGAALNNLAYVDSEHLGRLEKAYTLATKARELRPYDPYAADTLGWILYKQGQYSRAATLLQESAEKQPADPEVQMHLGVIYYMMDEEDAARVALQRALTSPKDFPEKERARQRLAILAIDPQTASPAVLTGLQKTVKDDPNDPVALDRIAAIEERSGKPDAAAQVYQDVLKQNPENWQAMLKLAGLYSTRLNDPAKALEFAKSAYKLAPDSPQVSLALGRAMYRSGDYPYALSLLQQASSQLAAQPGILYDLAWAYYSVGRVTQADKAMQDALASGAKWNHAEDARGFLAMRTAAASSAQARAGAPQVQAILQAHPNYVPALMAEGLIQEGQASYSAAEQTYQKVLAIYPLFAPATRELVILYAQYLHDDAKAAQLADKAGEAYPADTELSRTLGLLDYRRGDYSRSAQLLRQSVQNSNNDGEGFYYLGMDYYHLKQKSDSKQALQRAMALNLPPALAGDAKKVLGELK